MDKKLQYIIITASVIIAAVAFSIFAGFIPGLGPSDQAEVGSIVVWGTLGESAINPVINDFNNNYKNISVSYKQFDEDSYSEDLVNAIAGNRGPDVFMLPENLIIKHKDKAFIISFDTYPLRSFKNVFFDAGQIYAGEDGIVGLPFYADPMVLYWNKDLFKNANLAGVPKTWNEVSRSVSKLTIKDSAGRIIQSGIALGEFSNNTHAKDILALLMLQAGSDITNRKNLKPEFANRSASGASPAEEAILFFNDFSDSRKTTHTWNSVMPKAKQAFVEGRLAMYLGFASEFDELVESNPHLNFDVAEVPQIENTKRQTTITKMLAWAIASGSQNKSPAITFIFGTSGERAQSILSKESFTPPTLRSLLGQIPANEFLNVFYKSAIKSSSWLDPDPIATHNIFRQAVEEHSLGIKNLTSAVNDAEAKFNALMQ